MDSIMQYDVLFIMWGARQDWWGTGSFPLGPAIRHFALLLLYKEQQTISPQNKQMKKIKIINQIYKVTDSLHHGTELWGGNLAIVSAWHLF